MWDGWAGGEEKITFAWINYPSANIPQSINVIIIPKVVGSVFVLDLSSVYIPKRNVRKLNSRDVIPNSLEKHIRVGMEFE